MSLISIIIIFITILFSIKGFNDHVFFERYMFKIKSIESKDYIRLVTSGFLHVDFSHLLFNMLTLYFFAPVVIGHLGIISFILIYFISLLIGNVLTYYYHKSNLNYSAVGASGAVSGVLFSAILLFPNMSLYIMFIPIPIPAYIVGIGYLAYTVFGMKKQLGNIGHSAHLGGAITGLLLSILIRPELLQIRTFTLVLLAIPIILFFIIGKKIE